VVILNVALIIICVGFLLIILGYATNNSFFSLAGGFLLLISGILFLVNPLSVADGSIVNETASGVYEISTTYTSPPPLLNHAFNLIMLLIGMMFMYDSYIKLREDRYEKLES